MPDDWTTIYIASVTMYVIYISGIYFETDCRLLHVRGSKPDNDGVKMVGYYYVGSLVYPELQRVFVRTRPLLSPTTRRPQRNTREGGGSFEGRISLGLFCYFLYLSCSLVLYLLDPEALYVLLMRGDGS